jgi:hypothetical protein
MTETPLAKITKESSAHDSAAAEFYAVYDHYSKLLRTWLVAYGIGGPVLLLSSDTLLAKVSSSGSAKSIAVLFLFGVALQVLLAIANKTVMWVCYYGEINPAYCSKRRYKYCEWISEQFWIDFFVDVSSMILFGLATYETFEIVTGAS